jgi:ABC-type antimicrobial peptide transport system permease subunit
VNAYIARARLPEFGMRAMLGASPGRLFQVALTDTMRLIAFGVVGGIAGGYLLIRAMSSALFEVGDVMPLIFVLAVLAIAVVALAASWRPAAKAARMPVKRLLESA